MEEDEKDSGGHIHYEPSAVAASVVATLAAQFLSLFSVCLALSLSPLSPLDLPCLDSTPTCRVRFPSQNSAGHALHRPHTSPQLHLEDFSFLQQPSFDHFDHGFKAHEGLQFVAEVNWSERTEEELAIGLPIQ